jgi:hypothetical protein
MRGYSVTALPRTVRATAAALLLILALIGSAAAQTNLGLNSKPFSSTDWQQDQGNKTYIASKAFDGDLQTRWNSASGDEDGSFLGTRWDAPQTITKIVVHEAVFPNPRIEAFRLQQFDTAKNDWADVYTAADATLDAIRTSSPIGPVYTMRFKPALNTNGIRLVFDQVNTVPTIWEVEVYNVPSGTLQGTVHDEAGAPVAGAIIQAGTDTTTSDANGKYSITVDAGTFNVTAGKPGAFRTKLARSVTVAPDSNATLDFALVALPPNLALKAKGASSSDWEDGTDYNAAKANDGNLATRWNSRADDINGSWLEMDWDAPQTFTKVTVRESFDRIRNYTLQRWDSSTNNWADIVTNATVPAKGGNPVLSNVFAQPITSNKVRLLVVDSADTPSVFEMEVTNPATATIHGVVKNVATGQPVPRATVVSDLGETVVADANGAFTLVVEPDDYVLSASAQDFFPGKAVPVTIKAGETQEVTISLPATGPNLAKGQKTAASSEDSSYPATNAVDGDLDTYWTSASDQVTNQWIAVLFDKPTHFTAVQLLGFQGVIQKSYLEVLADDGKTWMQVPNSNINPETLGPNAQLLFPGGFTTAGVRFFILATNSTTSIPGVSEVQIFDSPLPQ